MNRYYFHLRNGTDEYLDPEGSELTDLAAVKRSALLGARELMRDSMTAGVLDLGFRFDVEDAAGTLVYSLPFAGAVSILGQTR